MIRLRSDASCCLVLLLSSPAFAASNPWFGTWTLKLSEPGQRPETLIYSDAGGGAMRMVSVEDRSVIVTHFDGKPAADQGTGADHGYALAVRSTSPTSYVWTLFKAGRPWIRGRNELAPDHKSFREVSWLIAKPGKTTTFTYEKQ